jgi:hypothetical protein
LTVIASQRPDDWHCRPSIPTSFSSIYRMPVEPW